MAEITRDVPEIGKVTYPTYPQGSGADVIIPHIPRMREIRTGYAALELAKYGQSWHILEILDGLRRDIGDASKLETGRRGLRDGYTPEKMAHEVSDLAWSFTVGADMRQVSPYLACYEAAWQRPVKATPRQLIGRLSIVAGMIDEIVDPYADPVFPIAYGAREQVLHSHFVDGFRTVASLARVCDVDLAQAIPLTMDGLEAKIRPDQTTVQPR